MIIEGGVAGDVIKLFGINFLSLEFFIDKSLENKNIKIMKIMKIFEKFQVCRNR